MEFIGEQIEVTQATGAPGPVRFVWRGRTYEVQRVLASWQDAGYGTTGAASRNWRTRHHRNYYHVACEGGERFELYLDREAVPSPEKRRRRRWMLVKRWTAGEDSAQSVEG
jgi:hypothetical protein